MVIIFFEIIKHYRAIDCKYFFFNQSYFVVDIFVSVRVAMCRGKTILCAEGCLTCLCQSSNVMKEKTHVGFQTIVSLHWSTLQLNHAHESCNKFFPTLPTIFSISYLFQDLFSFEIISILSGKKKKTLIVFELKNNHFC